MEYEDEGPSAWASHPGVQQWMAMYEEERATREALERRLDTHERIDLLDHGYIVEVEHWGSDERIIEAARMSTHKGFKGWGPIGEKECPVCFGRGVVESFDGHRTDHHTCEKCGGTGKVGIPGDEKLLRYLYENKHATPFEMAGMVIEVQAPIFVFRQWHRHRTQSYNELSGRYTAIPDLNYLPSFDRVQAASQSTKNKQAQRAAGVEPPDDDLIEHWRSRLAEFYDEAEAMYQRGLTFGIPKELARLCVPVARYSRMRASANLRNWLAFMTLRSHSHAQEEVKVYSDALGKMIAKAFPRTWELFVEGMQG